MALCAPSARATDWADTKEDAKDPGYAASRAICRALKGVVPPPGDAPTQTDAAALADCSSEALYFGIGRPADPKAARLCAFVEKRRADPQVEDFGFTGDGMLLMAYANGRGADRSLDVATALACRTGFAPAEIDGRVRHLARLKADHWAGTDFSLCDDITSGLMMGVCADHDQLVARDVRSRALAVLKAVWTPEGRTAFARLDRAKAGFVDARGQNEVDLSGTGRAAFEIAAEEAAEKAFQVLLDRVVAGTVVPATAAEAKAADDALNATYRDLIARAPKLFADSTVTTAGVASTERAWLRYRDAWLAFARQAYPGLSSDGLMVRLTRDRVAQLHDVPASQD